MQKWLRNYRAEFFVTQLNDNFVEETQKIIIEYPFTCQFEVDLGKFSAANRGSFVFVNLSSADQSRLWVDIFNYGKKLVYLNFYAGYGDTMPLIFSGNVQNCTSEKKGGSPDFITQVDAWEGGSLYRYGVLNATFTKGTTLESILKVVCQDDPNIKVGYVSPTIPPLKEDRTFNGKSINLLAREYQGYDVFIEKGELNILGPHEVIPGEVQVISDETGLLGSPKRNNGYLTCEMLFEPQLRTAQAISLISSTHSWLNMAYEIVKVNHAGIISPVVGGEVKTTVVMGLSLKETQELKKETTTNIEVDATIGIWQKPVQGKITSPFGQRTQPLKGASTNHKGIDIGAALNTPVYAPANGKVINAYINGNYGNYILIDNGIINNKPVTSAYGHLNSYIVTAGQKVSKGQKIGYVGSTGNSTGPHLHFEILEDGFPVNPVKYIGNY